MHAVLERICSNTNSRMRTATKETTEEDCSNPEILNKISLKRHLIVS